MTDGSPARNHPHGDGDVLSLGPAPAEAVAGLVLVHGRGGSAADIISLSRFLPVDGVSVRAPQARGGSWYPLGFLAPREDNEPGLSSGLQRLAEVLDDLERDGLERHRVLLLGFSQGACLALEYAARAATPVGGVVAFSGGLIGPAVGAEDYEGRLDGSRFFLGSSDPDPHVPWARVEESGRILRQLGASVDARRYPGMGHAVNEEELAVASQILSSLVSGRRSRADARVLQPRS
jgi:predicted esterase